VLRWWSADHGAKKLKRNGLLERFLFQLILSPGDLETKVQRTSVPLFKSLLRPKLL